MFMIKLVHLIHYSDKKISFRKTEMFFDFQNWLWKLKMSNFWSAQSKNLIKCQKVILRLHLNAWNQLNFTYTTVKFHNCYLYLATIKLPGGLHVKPVWWQVWFWHLLQANAKPRLLMSLEVKCGSCGNGSWSLLSLSSVGDPRIPSNCARFITWKAGWDCSWNWLTFFL